MHCCHKFCTIGNHRQTQICIFSESKTVKKTGQQNILFNVCFIFFIILGVLSSETLSKMTLTIYVNISTLCTCTSIILCTGTSALMYFDYTMYQYSMYFDYTMYQYTKYFDYTMYQYSMYFDYTMYQYSMYFEYTMYLYTKYFDYTMYQYSYVL